MASEDAYNAIRAKIVTDLGGSYSVLDWEDTESALADPAASFLALEEDFSDETPITVGAPGSNVFRETGAMRVHVFAPAKNGMAPCRAIAESVRDALRAKSLSDNVLTAAATPPTPGAINDGKWSSQIVNVDYSLDILR